MTVVVLFKDVSSSHEHGMICGAETSSAQYRHRGKWTGSIVAALSSAIAIVLACRCSRRLARGDGDESLQPPQGVRVCRLGGVLRRLLFPSRKAGEGVQVGVRNAIDVRPSLENPVFMDSDRSVVPTMALSLSVGGDQRSRHCMLVASRWPGRRNRGRVHDLRLGFETYGGLVRSRGLGPGLHGLLDLARPGASSVSGRGRVVDLEAIQPTVEAHLPL